MKGGKLAHVKKKKKNKKKKGVLGVTKRTTANGVACKAGGGVKPERGEEEKNGSLSPDAEVDRLAEKSA